MNNIFVIDMDIKESIGVIDFLPQREERLLLDSREYKVACVAHHPEQHATLIFVRLVEKLYSNMIKDIKWNNI